MRSAARPPLIAAGHWLAARFGLPMILSELGASAGLNLNWDRYAPDIGANFCDPNSPYAQLALESDSSGAESGAALTLRLWPDNQTIPLGRVDFHGRWVDWQAPELSTD